MAKTPIQKSVWSGPKPVLEAAQIYIEEFVENAAMSFRPAPGPDGISPQEGSLEADQSPWLLEVYLEPTHSIDQLNEALEAFVTAQGFSWSDATLEGSDTVEDKDWVRYALDGLGTVTVGRFLLFGSHDKDKIPSNDEVIPIQIDANQAFGTGHHPTTFGCLTILSRFAGAPPKNPLDLGCGSGVLSIAAAKLWGCSVLGVDIDPTSVEIAKENAAINGVADLVRCSEADGPLHPVVTQAAPYDFVFANILAGPLMSFAPGLAKVIQPAGRMLLAGLMDEQEQAVTTAYEAEGFHLINRLPREVVDTDAPVVAPTNAPGQHPVWPILLFVKR
ncbi:MAG: 50S ribosomal protein L11 methyltransferase [Pseudomonadota bacterium]